MSSNLLSVKDLHKSFVEGGSEIHVLRGLSLDLAEGERLAIVGESGVGKSTLLHILGTLDHPTSGKIFFRAKELPLGDESALCEFRNREVGFVFQFHYLLPDFSALENVMFPALIQGIDRAQAQGEAERPKLVLADEPTGSLDLRIGAEVQNLLFRLNEENNIALIVATHNREFAKKIGRCVELTAGALRWA